MKDSRYNFSRRCTRQTDILYYAMQFALKIETKKLTSNSPISFHHCTKHTQIRNLIPITKPLNGFSKTKSRSNKKKKKMHFLLKFNSTQKTKQCTEKDG
jgi:hypothetical protein